MWNKKIKHIQIENKITRDGLTVEIQGIEYKVASMYGNLM
jgi:hypothetical protein